MKKFKQTIYAIAGIAILVGCSSPQPEVDSVITESTYLPQDVKQSCTVSQEQFKTWFNSDSITENGAVSPANSVAFTPDSNCNFYRWSMQMFLWITSPNTSGEYQIGNTVLESPVFYTVTPSTDNSRTLIPHELGAPLKASAHISQSGPHKLPFLKAKNGKTYEVVKHNPKNKQTVLNHTGKVVEVKSVRFDKNGALQFIGKEGSPIDQPKANIKQLDRPETILHEFVSNGKSIYLDGEGNVIDSEEGQATGDGLIAQNGSLVYYITMVNDVYAYYLTAVKDPNNTSVDSLQFPTTAAERDSICAYARARGVTLSDSNALAIELKTSWVEAKDLPNADNYITIQAIIPTYQKTDTMWIPTGDTTTELALIGVHIVGSVTNHPEMVWATFEHKMNTPNAAYSYINENNETKTIAADTGTHWLFSSNAADNAPNVSHISVSGDTLNARTSQMINASNTLRTNAWGSMESISPNAEDKTTAAANSEMIAINNAIQSMLIGEDLRKNYLMIGATWTFGGTPPTGLSFPSDSVTGGSIGTSQLANSTMETYLDGSSFFLNNNSCFRCHSNNKSVTPGNLSHVFTEITPLFKYSKVKLRK